MTENSTKITKKPATSVKKNSSVKGSSKNKKRKKKRNNIGIICGTAAAAIVIVVGGGYFIGRAYYSNRFLSGTTVNGVDVGGRTFEQACDLLGVNDMPYELTVKTIDGTPVVFKTADFDYRLSGKDELQKIYDSVNIKTWFSGFIQNSIYSFNEDITFDVEKLQKLVEKANWGDVETADAKLGLNEDKTAYVITPEVQGNKITDMKKLEAYVTQSVAAGELSVELDKDTGCYSLPDVKSADLEDDCKKRNDVFQLSVTYDFDYTTETLTGEELMKMIKLKDDGSYTVDRKKAMEYVEKLAKKYDTYNTKRKFHATLQGDIIVPTSSDAKYGWWIDQEKTCDDLVDMLEKGESVDKVDPIYYSTGYFDFTGVESARSKDDDIGDTYIEIDLTDQHLWYYEKGKKKLDTYIVSGQTTSEARTTLPGVYKLWSKETNKRMKDTNADGDEWDTKCNFWNNVSLCGIGLHDSTWRGGYFGGEIYKYNGSHGCINMSYDDAKYVYDNVPYGTPVVMYYKSADK